jgi:MoaA/NifB/PqqE/SkfB family radical SAM enzyme
MISNFPLVQAVGESSLVEGLREALVRQPQAKSLPIWLHLATGELTEAEYGAALSTSDEITYLTLDTTGVCDLRCPGMCYYHEGINTRQPQVPFEALQEAILDASELGMEALVVGGREPFLNPARLFEILDYSGSIRKGRFAVGLISNGRNIERNWEPLRRAVAAGHLDFMDISIDSGFPVQHDAIRGVAGTFALASAAVREAVQEFSTVRVGISSVLRADNQEGVLELLRRMAPEVKNFCVQPIQPPPFSLLPALPSADVVEFLTLLVKLLETELVEASIEVLIMLHGPYVADAVAAGLFAWEDLAENGEGQIFAGRAAGSNAIYFNLMVLPDYGWKQARIDYRGNYLSHAHFLQTPDPSQHAVGNISKERIPVLLRRAKERGGLAYRLFESRVGHQCRNRSCWSSCFGGWTVAENDFLKGRSLSLQPSICRKTANGF